MYIVLWVIDLFFGCKDLGVLDADVERCIIYFGHFLCV